LDGGCFGHKLDIYSDSFRKLIFKIRIEPQGAPEASIKLCVNAPIVTKKFSNAEVRSWGEFVNEFYRTLGRLVYTHSLFDRNVGLQLHWLGKWYGTDVVELLDPKKVPFSKRLKKLKALVLDIYEPSGEKGLTEFTSLFERAAKATALRNDYVHGCWNWHYKNPSDGTMILTFHPLHWDMSANRADDTETIELDKFIDQVNDAEDVIKEYFRLTDKYQRYAKAAPTN